MKLSSALTLLSASLAHSQVVPPLACFGTSPIVKYDISEVASDLSGVAPGEGTSFFFVNNGDAIIYEIDLADFSSPALLNSFQMPMADPEGIAHMTGRTFIVPDENPSAVYECTFPTSDAEAVSCTTISSAIDPSAGENQGFEGVAYLSDGSIFAVQEMNTPTLWSVDSSDGSESMVIPDGRNDLTPALKVFGDMTSSYTSTDEVFLLSKLPVGVFRVDLTATPPAITDTYAGQICDMGQPEGLAFFQRAGVDYMMVAGEPNELRIFEASSDCSLALNSTVGDYYKCPYDATADMGCEKTLEDGGCEYSRCDKSTTPFIKICTDTNPGETDCTEAECKAHCVAGSTDDAAELNKIEGDLCTHWAYDVAESECYIFAGCNNIGFDADYVQYILQDPTCEKTMADGGCAQRRCDKNTNTNEKICTDTTPGETDCTLDECYNHCLTHTGFTCTTFAYDVAEKECYIFETCGNEAHDDDYTTYVLVDPTCEKNLADGGCIERRCDKLTNENEKVYSGDCDNVEQCQLACASYFLFDCKAYAYDPVDKDCYVFESCADEGFDDDYTLYIMGYDEKNQVIADNGGSGMCGATLSQGGCTKSRCSKGKNANFKICTDDSAETQCTLAECQDHCDTYTDFDCAFFSYDEAESECYLFNNCLEASPDDDYDTFARTCGKSISEGGCPDRRCDKDYNNFVKICDADAGTSCDLAACEAHCDAHTEFECKFFAWEEAEAECYIFASCANEHDDEYVLYSRACSKTLEEGGCADRRCDKGLTAHSKTCTDDEAGVSDCTLAQCESYCKDNVEKGGEDLGFVCNWFAYEEGPNECYLFEDCRNESPDSYVMYSVGAGDDAGDDQGGDDQGGDDELDAAANVSGMSSAVIVMAITLLVALF